MAYGLIFEPDSGDDLFIIPGPTNAQFVKVMLDERWTWMTREDAGALVRFLVDLPKPPNPLAPNPDDPF